jgi:hypothetical protein
MPDDESFYLRDKQVLRVRAWVYGLMIAYLAAVFLHALSILIAFWLLIIGIGSIPYQLLRSWSVGSGGLGVGALVFRVPVKGLFSGPL